MLRVKSKFFLTGEELSRSELLALIDLADDLRKTRGKERLNVLQDKTIALIFEKPSLRTRVSFTVGIEELGGRVIEISGTQKKSEDPEDVIRVLQGMVHGVMLRTFEHKILERMVSHAKIPIINGLSNSHHPCQALADLQTLFQKFGQLKGLKLAYIGDGNNVLHSLLLLMPFAGVDVHYCCPKGYEPDHEILARSKERAEQGAAVIKKFDSPEAAVNGVDALYTDVWTSMGFETENKERMKHFEGYQINMELLKKAKPEAIVLHCLPMNKGAEITQEVVDSPQAVFFQQAENRLHAQKALMIGIYNGLN
ncbi:MAG: ornithine carbamoyltransferase [Pseudomonadota bacterium]|nr:ornithine carbamoyltransferase [Pseudomonadota bacterium]